jgi:hypothetical protein
MIYIGTDEEMLEDRIRELYIYEECSEEFLELMRSAFKQNAVWLLLHA